MFPRRVFLALAPRFFFSVFGLEGLHIPATRVGGQQPIQLVPVQIRCTTDLSKRLGPLKTRCFRRKRDGPG